MQVYLPDDLYAAVKSHGLRASELLQEAVRAELHRESLRGGLDRYLAEREAEVGPPSPKQLAQAQALIDRLVGPEHAQRAG